MQTALRGAVIIPLNRRWKVSSWVSPASFILSNTVNAAVSSLSFPQGLVEGEEESP